MHIRITERTLAPSGCIVPAGTILDLPESEAMPMVEAGQAEALNPPAPAPEPEPVRMPEAPARGEVEE